jgi:hypothetical protein
MITRPRPNGVVWRLALVATLAGTFALASCSSGDETGSNATASGAPSTTAPSSTTVAPAAQSMRAKRYCEVLLVRPGDGTVSADVYNSYPLNDCPQVQWEQLDAKAIAAESGAPLAVLNGPRFWLMDRVEKVGSASDLPKANFGGIEMYRQASVEVGSIADAAIPYRAHAVDRKVVFTFDAGQTVYELTDPAGVTYVMQTWSQQRDPSLAESDLAGLGARLQLPAGWTFAARTLDAPLLIDTRSVPAEVLQDDLGNSYSQETAA